jgi:hypothetical protein
MDELYQQIGYPTPEQVAAADAAVDEEIGRLLSCLGVRRAVLQA